MRVIHVFNSDQAMVNPKSEELALLGNSAIHTYYRDCCRRAEFAVDSVRFLFHPLKFRESVTETILGFTESQEVLADVIIMGSIELTDPKNSARCAHLHVACAHHACTHAPCAHSPRTLGWLGRS